MQVHVAFQHDRPRVPHPGRNHHRTASFGVHVVDRLRERLRIHGYAVSDAARIGEVHRVVRKDGFLHAGHVEFQVLVQILVFIGRRRCSASASAGTKAERRSRGKSRLSPKIFHSNSLFLG